MYIILMYPNYLHLPYIMQTGPSFLFGKDIILIYSNNLHPPYILYANGTFSSFRIRYHFDISKLSASTIHPMCNQELSSFRMIYYFNISKLSASTIYRICNQDLLSLSDKILLWYIQTICIHQISYVYTGFNAFWSEGLYGLSDRQGEPNECFGFKTFQSQQMYVWNKWQVWGIKGCSSYWEALAPVLLILKPLWLFCTPFCIGQYSLVPVQVNIEQITAWSPKHKIFEMFEFILILILKIDPWTTFSGIFF